VEGVTTFEKRSERIVLEANTDYWDHAQFPRVHRIVFDNTLSPKEALELVKTSEGRVDLVNELRPLETLRVAESPFAKVVKQRGSLRTVWTWPHDSGHIWEARSPHLSCLDIGLEQGCPQPLPRLTLSPQRS